MMTLSFFAWPPLGAVRGWSLLRNEARRRPGAAARAARCLALGALLTLAGCGDRDAPGFAPGATNWNVKSDRDGVGENDTLDPSLSWPGYPEGSAELGSIVVGDYYDEDGQRGIHAVLITEILTDCPACQKLASDMPGLLLGGWNDKGIKTIDLIVQATGGRTATAGDALDWKNAFSATWAVGADPEFTFSAEGDNHFPVLVLVDPRTLTVERRADGYSDSFLSRVEDLAEANSP